MGALLLELLSPPRQINIMINKDPISEVNGLQDLTTNY